MDTYDVALWRYWPTADFPIVDEVQAETPYDALFSLMKTHQLKKVAYAAVRCPDGSIHRWQAVTLPQEEVVV